MLSTAQLLIITVSNSCCSIRRCARVPTFVKLPNHRVIMATKTTLLSRVDSPTGKYALEVRQIEKPARKPFFGVFFAPNVADVAPIWTHAYKEREAAEALVESALWFEANP